MKKITIVLISIIFVLGGTLAVTWTRYSKQQGVIDYLMASQRTMIWRMDDSCYNQLKNNSDGIIRLKIGEK